LSSIDKALSASTLTNGSTAKCPSPAHAARSNIHAGISKYRAISEPSKVQRKTEEAAALFTTSWTKTWRPNQG
jgi:hypothetical protein